MANTLLVNEIFLSLQGESTFAGLPCVFVRLTGCNLRCSYCDTAYAFHEGKAMPISEVITRVRELAAPFKKLSTSALPLVELTGGEPLLQKGSFPLMTELCDAGFTVLVETNGGVDISAVDPRARRIMDLKCPSTGEADRNCWPNIRHLKRTDEVKFVIATRQDYDWARERLAEHCLDTICPVLFSWASPPSSGSGELKPIPNNHTPISRRELAELMVADAVPARFQLQMHKFIWPPDQRGV